MNIERLKKLRISSGKSQQQIADALGIDRTTYVKYESGVSNPNVKRLALLAEYFNVSTSYLVGDDEPNQEKWDLQLFSKDELIEEATKLLQQMPPEMKKAALEQLKALAALNKK